MLTNLPEKRYYSIGEVAKAFSANPSLIRFWEKEFEVLTPKKNAKGDRKFSVEDVKNLEIIFHLVKEKGFTLEGAKAELKLMSKPELSNIELVKKLEKIKVSLLAMKENL